MQYTYDVLFNDGAILTNDFLKENGITCEDLGLSGADKAYFKSEGQIQLTQQFRNNRIIMPMTKQTAALLKSRKDLVQAMAPVTGGNPAEVYPLNMVKDWTRDNYGPVWIPKKGETCLSMSVLSGFMNITTLRCVMVRYLSMVSRRIATPLRWTITG